MASATVRRFVIPALSLAFVSAAGVVAFARASEAPAPNVFTSPATGEDRPTIGGWPGDVDGDEVISDTGAERIPELIRAAGDHGVAGYVRYEELEGPQPSNPEEALAMSGQERVINLYAADGITVLDTYTIT
jgi:hypothetical protein